MGRIGIVVRIIRVLLGALILVYGLVGLPSYVSGLFEFFGGLTIVILVSVVIAFGLPSRPDDADSASAE